MSRSTLFALLLLASSAHATPLVPASAVQSLAPVAILDPPAVPNADDTDGDGVISPAEHALAAKRRFERLDTNHDGVLSAQELRAAMTDAAVPGARPLAEQLRLFDRDGNGVVTLQEYAWGASVLFDRTDLDGDGYLNATELAYGRRLLLDRYALEAPLSDY